MDLNIFSKFVREKFKTNEFIPLHVPTFIGNEEKYIGNTIKYLNIFNKVPYIFNLGHGILPETEVDKVDRLIKFYRNFN